jgi:hypothetical protein
VFSLGGDSGPLLVHVHNGRVDHLRTDSECVHHLIPGPSHPPASEAIIASGLLTNVVRQIAPLLRLTPKPQNGV